MPLINADGSLYQPGVPKKNNTNNEWKTLEREERNSQRNEHQREQYAYYIGLYEKYKSNDWDYVKMKLDEDKNKERRKNESIRKENQKKWDDANAAANMFGPMRKKDMYGGGSFQDKL